MNHSNTRILVIDAHPIIRDGLADLLAPSLECSEVVGCGDFAEAKRHVGSHLFSLVVSDFRILGETVLSFLQHLGESPSKAPCLIYSEGDELQVGYPCMRAGAAGFVSKAAPVERVVEGAKTVLKGRPYVSEPLARLLMNHQDQGQPLTGANLSLRELEVFSMIGTGMTVSKIAERLEISVKTVEAHRENIKKKLGCTNASEVVAAAARWLDEKSRRFDINIPEIDHGEPG